MKEYFLHGRIHTLNVLRVNEFRRRKKKPETIGKAHNMVLADRRLKMCELVRGISTERLHFISLQCKKRSILT